MKICVKCQLEYNDKYTFCQKCGCKLELKEEKNTCSNCGNVIETNGGFCPFCGTAIATNKQNADNASSEVGNTNKTLSVESQQQESAQNKIDIDSSVKETVSTIQPKNEPIDNSNEHKKIDFPAKKVFTVLLVVMIIISALLYDKYLKDEAFKYKLYDAGLLSLLGAEEQYKYAEKLYDEKNYKGAFKWYKVSAENGYASAQNNLGVLYTRGWGVEKSDVQAIYWYLQSAKQGDDTAQCNVAYCYLNGEGTDKDIKEAKKWFEKSAMQGNAKAKKGLKEIERIELWEKAFPSRP